MLKRYVDYSNKELAVMTDAEISKLIDIECMINGVTPLNVEPTQMDKIEIPEPDVQVFCVNAQNILFTDMEEAKAVADLINKCKSRVTTDYDYTTGYNCRYVKREDSLADITTNFHYSKEVHDKYKDTMISNQRISDKNKELIDEYKSRCSEFNELRDSVIEAYNSAAYEMAKYQNAKNVYKSYLDISDGDEETAKNFFKETEFSRYMEEILEDLENERSHQADGDD